jgi:nicotinamidase-related amidase
MKEPSLSAKSSIIDRLILWHLASFPFLLAQRDFLLAGGFGEMLGNDVTKLQRAIEPCANLLAVARKLPSLLVMHTREGHRMDMTDVHDHKQRKGAVIGSPGPMGRILLRGEPGHDIIPELYPIAGEPIIDKPGKVSY